jgi:C1A family cysteine protease
MTEGMLDTPLPVRTTRRLGWKPDLPDPRDFAARKLGRFAAGPLPKTVRLDLRKVMPAVYDQGYLGSCTANAIAAAVEFTLRELRRKEKFTPSRLAIYYGERVIEGSVNSDDGAYIRDGFKVISVEGVAPETLWPYREQRFKERPPQAYYDAAKYHECVNYGRVDQTAEQLQRVLHTGDPIVFGFSVFTKFMTDEMTAKGILHVPGSDERMEGGHAVMLVGYVKRADGWYFIVRNSWGPAWGRKGYFLMHFDYVLNPDLSDDFWRTTIVE